MERKVHKPPFLASLQTLSLEPSFYRSYLSWISIVTTHQKSLFLQQVAAITKNHSWTWCSDQQFAESSVLTELREHHKRGGRKTARARGPISLLWNSLSWQWFQILDQSNIKINEHVNVEGKIFACNICLSVSEFLHSEWIASRSIHLPASFTIPFFLTIEYHIIEMYSIFIIHSSSAWQLGCFLFLGYCG